MGASRDSRKRVRESQDDLGGMVVLAVVGIFLLVPFLRTAAAVPILLIAVGVALYLSARMLRNRRADNVSVSNVAMSVATGLAVDVQSQLPMQMPAHRASPVPLPTVAPVLPYSLRERFFSQSEGLLYAKLKEAFLGRYLIFAKVRLADICADLDPPDQGALNRIWSKHIDFILCEPTTFRIVAGIELDGWNHSRPKQIANDQFKDDVFERIGVPLMRYRVQSPPSSVELARSIGNLVQRAG